MQIGGELPSSLRTASPNRSQFLAKRSNLKATEKVESDSPFSGRVTAQLTHRFSSTQFMRPVRLNCFVDRYAVRHRGGQGQLPP